MKGQGVEVVITGVGPVTPIGTGGEAFWSALCAGESKVAPRQLVFDAGVADEIPLSSMPSDADVPGLAGHLAFLAEQDCGGYRDLAYAICASELALADADLKYDRAANNIGVIQVFEAPGAEHTVGRLFAMLSGPPPTDGPPKVYDHLAPSFYNMQPFLYVQLLGKALGFHGYSTSVHNACSSGAYAIEEAAQRIRSGQAEVMVVTGGEAFETGVRLEWFRRLNLYAADHRMAPFESEPTGFFVGEGAGAIVLESAEHAARRGASVYAAYAGGAFAHQAWKQTIPDVRAARLADVITRSFDVAGVAPSTLDLVVPHGTATSLSDGYEASCLKAALTPSGRLDGCVATAFKPHVGHLLAASGVVETIGALLAIRHQTVPATLHTHADRTRLPMPIATTTVERRVDTVLKLGTGFTGHDAALVFRKA